MERWLVLIVMTVLVTGGVWGSIVLSGLFKRRSLKSSPEDPRFERLTEDNQRLEARLEQLEEEVGFLRELHRPETPPQLPGSEQS